MTGQDMVIIWNRGTRTYGSSVGTQGKCNNAEAGRGGCLAVKAKRIFAEYCAFMRRSFDAQTSQGKITEGNIAVGVELNMTSNLDSRRYCTIT